MTIRVLARLALSMRSVRCPDGTRHRIHQKRSEVPTVRLDGVQAMRGGYGRQSIQLPGKRAEHGISGLERLLGRVARGGIDIDSVVWDKRIRAARSDFGERPEMDQGFIEITL